MTSDRRTRRRLRRVVHCWVLPRNTRVIHEKQSLLDKARTWYTLPSQAPHDDNAKRPCATAGQLSPDKHTLPSSSKQDPMTAGDTCPAREKTKRRSHACLDVIASPATSCPMPYERLQGPPPTLPQDGIIHHSIAAAVAAIARCQGQHNRRFSKGDHGIQQRKVSHPRSRQGTEGCDPGATSSRC